MHRGLARAIAARVLTDHAAVVAASHAMQRMLALAAHVASARTLRRTDPGLSPENECRARSLRASWAT
jgi:hypothetical protein